MNFTLALVANENYNNTTKVEWIKIETNRNYKKFVNSIKKFNTIVESKCTKIEFEALLKSNEEGDIIAKKIGFKNKSELVVQLKEIVNNYQNLKNDFQNIKEDELKKLVYKVSQKKFPISLCWLAFASQTLYCMMQYPDMESAEYQDCWWLAWMIYGTCGLFAD